MVPFLKAVARAYRRRYDDMSDFCFVFPNKRSGTFFLKYLRSGLNEGRIAPEITTVTDFVARVGDSVVDNRIASLFTLYRCYCALLPEKAAPAFDAFRTWGETVLSDFNEVGMNCSDPDSLFRNLRDHREIQSDFLTDEQRRVMEEYFGTTAYKEEESSFWRHFNNPEHPVGESDERDEAGHIPLRRRFMKLWEALAPLYDRFNETLKAQGLVSSSGAYRAALKALEERGREALPWQKVVFVGFNALTHVELDIFKELAGLGSMDCGPHPDDALADFIWDATGPVFKRMEEAGSTRNSAARFVAANRKRFPEPEWAEESLSRSDTDSLPEILRSVGSPSNVLQAKIAADEVKRIYGENRQKKINDARVAVVLPDESLLVPFLYGLPEYINDVNLTMGYPLRLTSSVSFISQLRQTLRSSRDKNGETLFYLPDLKLFLAHPVTKTIAGEKPITDLILRAEKLHQIMVSRTELAEAIPGLRQVLDFPGSKASVTDVLDYLDSVLVLAADSLTLATSAMLKTGLDSENFEAFREGLRPLRNAVAEHPVAMSRDTVFALAQRLVGSLRVQFEGEPLRGLQVMGLLETRSLDFDIVIIPSLNERILPLKARSRTFIPNSLRAAYGLPPSNYSENLFAYYFYRLISRAREVVMIHDARSGSGLRTGGPSRYVHQLEHIFAPGQLIQEECSFELSEFAPVTGPVEKTPAVMERVNEYLYDPVLDAEEAPATDGEKTKRRVLSATALNDYCKCEKLFFFKHIVKIPETRESTLHVDHVQLGNIVHGVMEEIYTPASGKGPLKVDAPFIDSLLKEDSTEILRLATLRMQKEFDFLKKLPGLPPDYEIVRDTVVRMVRGILKTDRSLAMSEPTGSFEVLGCEEAGTKIMRTGAGRDVRFRYSIDRADTVGGSLRIVDYKTGSVHAKGKGFDEMFDDNSTSMSNFLQLMAYAGIARGIWPGTFPEGVGMVLYRVTEMTRENPSKNVPPIVKPAFLYTDSETGEKIEKVFETDEKVTYSKREVIDGKSKKVKQTDQGPEYREEFDRRLADKIDTIFDKPDFDPTANTHICPNCAFAMYCLR